MSDHPTATDAWAGILAQLSPDQYSALCTTLAALLGGHLDADALEEFADGANLAGTMPDQPEPRPVAVEIAAMAAELAAMAADLQTYARRLSQPGEPASN